MKLGIFGINQMHTIMDRIHGMTTTCTLEEKCGGESGVNQNYVYKTIKV